VVEVMTGELMAETTGAVSIAGVENTSFALAFTVVGGCGGGGSFVS